MVAIEAEIASGNHEALGNFNVTLIGSFGIIAHHKFYFRRIYSLKIRLLALPGNIVSTTQYGLHPAQATIARRADLFLRESWKRQVNKSIASLMQLQCAVRKTCTDNFAVERNIHKKIR